jgi:general secretion pathway protein F
MSDGFTPLEINSGTMNLIERLNQPVGLRKRIGRAEQSLIMTQLAMLIRSGLPIDRSLDLLREQSPKAKQAEILGQILGVIRSGGSLSAGFEQQAVFPAYVVGVIRSAEQSGRLGAALTNLAQSMTASTATRRQLVTALTYPLAVLAATFIALILVLVVVVPQFEPVFAGEEARLPTLTRGVLALSSAVTNHGLLITGAISSTILMAIGALRSRTANGLTQAFRHHIPGLGLRDQYLAAQFTGILATLVGNGVTAIKALPLARDALSSPRWRRHIAQVEQSVREGQLLSAALGEDDLVPSTAVRLIEVGERSGRLADTCHHASVIMGEAARARIDRIVSLANPIAIVSLGGIVAMLVAGVMLGIFALGDFAG